MRVSGSLKVVTDAPDLVTRVTVRASHVRTDGGDVVTTSPESIPVEGGVVDFQILPGPAMLVVEKLSGEGAPSWPIVVPDRGEGGHATLAEVVEAGEIASDSDRRVLETLALQVQRDRELARESASESAESADVSARNAAATAKDAEATAADRVQTGKDRVATGEDRKHVDARRTHVDEQVVHVDRQVRHTDEQVVHVDERVRHVDGQVDFVAQARDEATEAADRVGTAEEVGRRRDEAVEAASRATGAASKAEGHERGAASAAAAEVEKLKGDAPEAFDTLGEIAKELEKNESERAALANSIGEKARRAEVNAALDSKSDVGHIHSVSDVDGLEAGLAEAGKTGEWGQLSGKPSAFPPGEHRHEVDDVDGLGTALAGAGQTAQWSQVTGKPSAFPPESHTHAAHNIIGLNNFVDERAGDVVAANGPRIERVSALPSSPDPDVLYVVVE